MSGEIVNLRRARKTKQRQATADAAAENRVRFGRSKAECTFTAAVEKLTTRHLDAHRLERVAQDASELPMAFSSEVASDSREENASKQVSKAAQDGD